MRRVEEVERLLVLAQREFPIPEYEALRKKMREFLHNPYGKSVQDNEEAAELFDNINCVHEVRAQEAKTGHDVSPRMTGNIVPGSIHNKEDNLQLLKTEVRGRMMLAEVNRKGRDLTINERSAIDSETNKMKINALKKWLKADEKSIFMANNEGMSEEEYNNTEASKFICVQFTDSSKYFQTKRKQIG